MGLFEPKEIKELKKKRDIEGLIKLLESGNGKMRERAAIALKDLGDEKAIDPLIDSLIRLIKSGRAAESEHIQYFTFPLRYIKGDVIESLLRKLEKEDGNTQKESLICCLYPLLVFRDEFSLLINTFQRGEHHELCAKALVISYASMTPATSPPKHMLEEVEAALIDASKLTLDDKEFTADYTIPALGRFGNEAAVGLLINATKGYASDEDPTPQGILPLVVYERKQGIRALLKILQDKDTDEVLRKNINDALARILVLFSEKDETAAKEFLNNMKKTFGFDESRTEIVVDMVLDEMIDALKTPDEKEHENIVGVIASLPPRLSPHLLKYIPAIGQGYYSTLLSESKAIERLGTRSESAKKMAEEMRKAFDEKVYGGVISAIRKMGKDAIDNFLIVINEPDSEVKFYIANVLKEVGGDAIEPLKAALTENLKDTEEVVRWNTAIMLAEIGDIRSIDTLKEILVHGNAEFRSRVASCLKGIKDDRVIELALKALKDGNERVREECVDIIDKLQVKDKKVFIEPLTEIISNTREKEDIRESAILAMDPRISDITNDIEDNEIVIMTVEALKRAEKDESESVRIKAGSVLVSMMDLIVDKKLKIPLEDLFEKEDIEEYEKSKRNLVKFQEINGE